MSPPANMSTLTCETGFTPTPSSLIKPRYITAAEVLAERDEQRSLSPGGGHGTGTGWSSMLWISCDCHACRTEYDPTGEESTKYMNMEFPSFFNSQSELPSFILSKLFKESYLAAAGPGFYIGSAKKAATLDDVILVITPPLVMRPARILHISKDYIWDEFILYEAKTLWRRRTYAKGRSIWYKEGEDQAIPFAALGGRLQELFGVSV